MAFAPWLVHAKGPLRSSPAGPRRREVQGLAVRRETSVRALERGRCITRRLTTLRRDHPHLAVPLVLGFAYGRDGDRDFAAVRRQRRGAHLRHLVPVCWRERVAH